MQVKAFFCFFLFILLGNSLMLPAQEVFITGEVHDQKNKESLPFAQVALFKGDDTTCLNGGLTDDLGKFAIAVSPEQTYHLKIHFLGYESFETSIELQKESVDLGIISLRPSAQNLQEIFVTAEKKSIGKENGNWVLYPDKLPDAGTNSASELLSSIPSVSVDMDDEISIRGRQASILIDGVKIDDQSELDQISPSAIAKIEVIQNPSAKYDADASVINIQLKAPIQSRSSSNIKASVDHLGNHQENFSANSKFKNWGAFMQANSNWNEFETDTKMERQNLLSTGSPYLIQERNQSMINNKQQLRTGLNHSIGKKHYLKFDMLWQSHQSDPDIHTQKEILGSEKELKKIILQDQQNERDKISQQYRAHYIGKWEKEVLKVRSIYRKQKQWENRTIESRNYHPDGSPYGPHPYVKKDDIDYKINNYQVIIDYEKSISSSVQIEAGANWKYESHLQDAIQQKLNQENEEWNIVPSKTFNYEYKMRSYAGYGIFQIKRDKWFLTGGSRLRFIEMSTSNSREDNFSRQYNFYPSILPTLSVGVNWEQGDLSFSYKKSQKLPKAHQLNSYKNDANPLNIYFGNPDLKPEKEHSFSLDYSIQKEKLQVGVAVFHRMVKDVVMQKYSTHGDTLFRSFENMADQMLNGTEYTFNYKPKSWCRLNGSFTFYHQKFTGKELALPKKQSWSYHYKLSSQFQLPKQMRLMLNYSYSSENLKTNGLKGSLYHLDAAMSKDFFDKKLKISIKGANLLDSKRQWNDVENLQFVSRNHHHLHNRRVILGMVYKWSHRK